MLYANSEKCTLCGDSVIVCPTSAIRVAEPVHAMVGNRGLNQRTRAKGRVNMRTYLAEGNASGSCCLSSAR